VFPAVLYDLARAKIDIGRPGCAATEYLFHGKVQTAVSGEQASYLH
jgi:hypothetical protein